MSRWQDQDSYNDAMYDAVSIAINSMGYREVAEMVADWRDLGGPGDFREWQRDKVWQRIERQDELNNQSYFEGFE